jgi:hypothetical protein
VASLNLGAKLIENTFQPVQPELRSKQRIKINEVGVSRTCWSSRGCYWRRRSIDANLAFDGGKTGLDLIQNGGEGGEVVLGWHGFVRGNNLFDCEPSVSGIAYMYR